MTKPDKLAKQRIRCVPEAFTEKLPGPDLSSKHSFLSAPPPSYLLTRDRLLRWEKREEILAKEADLPAEERELLLQVLESVATGGKFRDALGAANRSWRWYNTLTFTRPALMELHKVAVEMCRLARRFVLEDEAFSRAIEGEKEPVYTPGGRLVGNKIRKSDALLAMLLRAYDPDRFGAGVAGAAAPSGPTLVVNLGLRPPPSQQEPIDVTPVGNEEGALEDGAEGEKR